MINRINDITKGSHGSSALLIIALEQEGEKRGTVEPRLSGPRLSGFLDYPDFFSSPNFVMNIHYCHDQDS